MVSGINAIVGQYKPLSSFVKSMGEVFRGLLLRFFTNDKELAALSPERIKNLSLIEVSLLSATQLKILGIQWFPKKTPSVYSEIVSLPLNQLFHKLTIDYETTDDTELKHKIADELISIVVSAEKRKKPIPAVFLLECYLINRSSYRVIAPHLSKESKKALVQRIRHNPLIMKNYTLQGDSFKKDKSSDWSLHRISVRHKNLTVQEIDDSSRVYNL